MTAFAQIGVLSLLTACAALPPDFLSGDGDVENVRAGQETSNERDKKEAESATAGDDGQGIGGTGGPNVTDADAPTSGSSPVPTTSSIPQPTIPED